MKDAKYTDSKLIFIQRVSWYLIFVLFAVVTSMFFFKNQYAVITAQSGVVFVLIVTLLKIFILAEKFRLIKLRRLVVLSYILIVILLSTVIIKYIL